MTSDPYFHPVSGAVLPRYAGLASFMRLPVIDTDHPRRGEVDVGLFGMPWDGGTSNRPGARHGPRALRDASTMIRAENGVSGVRPFEALACADLGDIGCNPVDQDAALGAIERFVSDLVVCGARPLGVGGDHLCTLPVLRGLVREGAGDRPALVLLDSHTDLNPPYFGSRTLTHGNPFRQAVEEGLIDAKRSVMVGMRGTMYDRADRDFAADHGITILPMHDVFARGLAGIASAVHRIVGSGPAYMSFDIDFIDPAHAPGTGTPEVGGPSSAEALRLLQGLAGLHLIGADLVEVSPPFDSQGITAWLGASVLFEILCLMAVAIPAG